ncbi:type I-E CRISPR-associated protein Cse1/CasA (plasmid) [Streptomyces zhihengii]|uniref:Type I-E CRISPR-associated protein Cse1/CasA n=1 Tax=Streptomyces zhihengii TaxID=1818004 RepID=A0ABS2V537_9ACTN|nr:type I-E CRISPR-associated protein Cse1/CasA [Streptomyces zhihengii]MBM9624676.1 type I-E CRISPR-associated protein Cse1/CasA [Streptomyces zhihengii]
MATHSEEGTSASSAAQSLPVGLSDAARSVWAKHARGDEGWLPLWRHLADSGAVAGLLWERWLPESVKRVVREGLPGGEEEAERLVRFLAASHDIGKCSPAFACQVEELAGPMRDRGLDMPTAKEYGQARRLAPHGLAGQLLLQEWLRERHALGARISGQFAVVVGGHHGVPPESGQIHDVRLRPQLLRHPGASEEVWRRTQFELLDWCAELCDATAVLGRLADVRLSQPAQVLLTAMVIVSDWIASAPELFPYAPESWLEGGESRRLRAAWEGLELPAPWHPAEPAGSVEELFGARFPRLAGAGVRPVQAEAVRLAREMATSGLLIVEAPMGEGKTEAALAAAEVLAARSGAGGLLLALPTRATSDAMFRRLRSWLDALPAGDGGGIWSVVLAHAKAALQSDWAGLLREGSRAISAVDPDGDAFGGGRGRWQPSGLHAHQWLRGRKKQLLASFAVGTVDQVLFAGLKSRHLALRHLAVAGKVVVIDEVHAYDAYMGRYLDRALEWLAAYGVPVVLLSATLPAARRKELAAAYGGAEAARAVVTAAGAYPLVTAVARGREAITARPAAASGRCAEVVVERLDDDVAVLADRLEAELADGGCALVVRNTVARVLEAARVLRERFGEGQVTVAHSRFLAADRAVNDVRLVERYGPGGDRPGRHVVVASQVVEQSLDVSFDLLVTDLAPVDLVLQRMGRLHRHPAPGRPVRLVAPKCLITGVVDWKASPPVPVKASRAVYRGDWTLLRASAALAPHLDGVPVRLPDDISLLVQRAYSDEAIGPGEWAEAAERAHERHAALLEAKRRRADGFLLGHVGRPGRPLYGWLEAHAGDADDSLSGRAQVRDSDESLDVLVVMRWDDGRITTVPWLDGGRAGLDLPVDFPPSRRAAEAVAASALTLPGRFCHPGIIDRTIAELEQFLVPAWQVKESPWLAGQLILVLDERCQTRLSGFEVHYSPQEGLSFAMPGEQSPGGHGDAAKRSKGDERNDAAQGDQGGGVRTEGDASTIGQRREQPGGDGGGSAAGRAEAVSPASARPPAFNLVRNAWLPVQRISDGAVEEVSLRELFARAGEFRRFVGDVPTQEIALLRLTLAVLYDAHQGPADLDAWLQLWEPDADDSFCQVTCSYLDTMADRFELFDEERPFFQSAGLRTAKDEVGPLSRIVADASSGGALFSMRWPGVERIPFAEAARWLVHAHAFDVSGIKSAMRQDTRAKAGKVYPLGEGSLGVLGGVFAEGETLRETLLLNLVPFEEAYGGSGFEERTEMDRPVWCCDEPYGPGPRGAQEGGLEPAGLRDLYTWQTRRIRLVADADAVSGVVLGYGDPPAQESPWVLEPMTAWRRSQVQEKKRKRVPYYTPLRHQPRRAAWRGLASLLHLRAGEELTGKPGEAAQRLRPRVTKWLGLLATELADEELLPLSKLVRLRTVGVEYGTQQSVIDEIVDDAVVLPVITLHAGNEVYGAAAVDAVSDADQAVGALAQLAANLVRAAGGEHTDAAMDTVRDRAFGALDGPYRAWLRELAEQPDLPEAQQQWRETVRRQVNQLARQEIRSAGRPAVEGRMVDLPGRGATLLDAGRADLWFRGKLERVLGTAPRRTEGVADSAPPADLY